MDIPEFTPEQKKLNAELISQIDRDLVEYDKIRAGLDQLYKKETEVENRINHAVHSMIVRMALGEDAIQRIESFIGKKIMYVDDGSTIVMNVHEIRWDKYELSFLGSGAMLSEGGSVYDKPYLTIEYRGLSDTLDKISIVEDDSDKIREMLLKRKEEMLASAIEKITERFNNDIAELDKYLAGKPIGESHICRDIWSKAKIGNPRSHLSDIADIKWGQLVKTFGDGNVQDDTDKEEELYDVMEDDDD